MTKRALIFGIGGQDGTLLSLLLQDKGYEVHGTSRGRISLEFDEAKAASAAGGPIVHVLEVDDSASVSRLLGEVEPHEIYYLASQSSVAQSFADPVETWRGAAVGLVTLIASIAETKIETRLFNAASGECFGILDPDRPATETSPFAPRSPYAAAKCASHHAVAVARAAYGVFACSGFLFSHESPLRPESFVIAKVAATARRIAAGSSERLRLGGVDVIRDWGWAEDYVEAMWLMLQQADPEDFVIATGESRPLRDLVSSAFRHVGLDWRDHVDTSAVFPRRADIPSQYADPSRARSVLGWTAKKAIDDIMAALVTER
jgi:GDPmannose 4,6-dehydratase